MLPRVTTPVVRPFPFASLEALSRAEVDGAASLRRFARAHARIGAIAGAIADLLGEDVEVFVTSTRRVDGTRGADDSIGVMVAPADGARGATRRALVEVEGALGARIAARVLQQRGPLVTDPARIAPPALAGAVAAVLAAALRRAHSGSALKVIAAGPGHALARDLAAATPDATAAWLTVIVGADAFAARITVPDAACAGTVEPAPLGDALRALGDAPVALPLLAATTLAKRSHISALRPGDALLPPSFPLAASDAGWLAGPIALVAPASERGLAADLAPDGRLVVRGHLASHPWDAPMPEPSQAVTLEALEDAPVVVRVELGAVELSAREWAELSEGDVLALGRRLGDAAVLRVGGVEIARGELVSVDGEYGVRILSRRGVER